MSREEKLKCRGEWIKTPCPKCKSKMLQNQLGDTWCSECDFGLTDYREVGNCVRIGKSERVLP